MKIDYEGISDQFYKHRKLYSDYQISAMKEAVRQSIPLILQIAADKAEFTYEKHGCIEHIQVNKQSITGLEDEIKKQLGL